MIEFVTSHKKLEGNRMKKRLTAVDERSSWWTGDSRAAFMRKAKNFHALKSTVEKEIAYQANNMTTVHPREVKIVSKYVSFIALTLVSLLLLSSCRVVGDFIGLKDRDRRTRGLFVAEGTLTDIRMEEILTAIKDKDSNAIKLLFSKKAISESDNLDDGIKYLFDYIKGNIDSYEQTHWDSDESREYGKKTLMIRFSVKISTDEDEYDLFVADFSTDTINPDNEGVYMMKIIRMADKADQPPWIDILCAGIYRPDK